MSIVRKPVVEPSGWWQNVQPIRQTRLSQMNLDQSKEGRVPQVQWAVIIFPADSAIWLEYTACPILVKPQLCTNKNASTKKLRPRHFQTYSRFDFFWLKGPVWKILTQIVHLKKLRWLQKTSFSGLFLSEPPGIDVIPSALFCCMQTWFF